jgi:hypothetical protein
LAIYLPEPHKFLKENSLYLVEAAKMQVESPYLISHKHAQFVIRFVVPSALDGMVSGEPYQTIEHQFVDVAIRSNFQSKAILSA